MFPQPEAKRYPSPVERDPAIIPYLLSLLNLHLPCSPGDNVQVNDGVEDQQQVHGGDGQEVDEDGKDTLELLRMEDGCYEERTHHGDQKDGGRRSYTVLSELESGTNKHCHHDQSVCRR